MSRAQPLPEPAPEARAHSARVISVIEQEIAARGGWMDFARFMALALHEPGLGYYSAGARKFGADGDFITAPELGSVFGATLARQAAQCLRAGLPTIIEFGAGSGRLACDLLSSLDALDCLPRRYLILETSAELRQRQRDLLSLHIPQFMPRIEWLDELPATASALVIANEVLDAMPVHLITVRDEGTLELGVACNNHSLEWQARPATGAVLTGAARLSLAPGYTTEIHLAAPAFVRTLASHLARGVVLLIDYGFPAREYYHPQRDGGTLMCHYRQRAHGDALTLVGLQDVTAHVDFTAIAEAATASGLELLGYTTQAQFLINCGITEVLQCSAPKDAAAYLPQVAQAQKLTSPAEMGELFKVIALGRDYPDALLGFAQGDKSHTL